MYISNFLKTYIPFMPQAILEEIVANGSSQMTTEASKLEIKWEAQTSWLLGPMAKRLKSYLLVALLFFGVDSPTWVVKERETNSN